MEIDRYLGVHGKALLLASQRNELLAANLANADTPQFKSRDIDFKAALAEAGSPAATLPLRATQARHIDPAGGAAAPGVSDAELKYRVPLAPALDGNTVDAQLEQAAFAENAVRYQSALTFINGRLRSLMTAITGQ